MSGGLSIEKKVQKEGSKKGRGRIIKIPGRTAKSSGAAEKKKRLKKKRLEWAKSKRQERSQRRPNRQPEQLARGMLNPSKGEEGGYDKGNAGKKAGRAKQYYGCSVVTGVGRGNWGWRRLTACKKKAKSAANDVTQSKNLFS